MSRTQVAITIHAPRSAVYRALLDPDVVRRWMVPDNMTSVVHAFDARVGGMFRISLTYTDKSPGKSNAHTDTFHGTFVELVPDERVVQRVEFETTDPAMQGASTIRYELADDESGTRVTGTHDDLPRGIRPEDNELGWTMSLRKLRDLVERG